MFKATELLRAIVRDKTTPARTAAHDLESFCWVFASTVYLRGVQDALDSETQAALQRERRRIFAATSYQELLNSRAVALPADLCEAFYTIQERLDTCWYLLKGSWLLVSA